MIVKSGNHVEHFTVNQKSTFTLDFEPNSQGSFVCFVDGEGEFEVNLNVHSYSNWDVLWVNRSDDKLKIQETIHVFDHVHLKLNYGELSQGNHIKNTLILMEGLYSQVHLKGATLVLNRLKWHLSAIHKSKHTFAQLDNHAIVLRDTQFEMEVTGQIDKGFGKSETHQMTRILNLGDESNAIVFPKLLIDENDVAASHAASVGRPNEEHIYYLQSRGLSKKDAMRLLLKGYLLPITEGIQDLKIKEALIEEIEMKVDAL